MTLRRSRREIQREHPPGTLFAYYDAKVKGCRVAMVMWWESVKTSSKHPATWIAKCLADGTIVNLHWERFNDDEYIEVLGHGKEDRGKAA